MKFSYKDLKKLIPQLNWSLEDLASKLSIIGHETEVLADGLLDVKLTSNRKDCQDINYLAFDLVALYNDLGSNTKLIKYESNKKIYINLERINKILGTNISHEEYKKIEKLGFVVSDDNVVVPDFRIDVFEGADIAEEVFRAVGVEKLDIKPLDRTPEIESSKFEYLNSVRAALSKISASETRSISFTRAGTVKLKNPFSTTLPFMRETLLFGLLEAVSKNPYLRRNFFYEIGNVFKPTEHTKIGFIITGHKKPESLINAVEKTLGLNLTFNVVENNYLDEFSVKQPNVMFCEIDINDIKSSGGIKYKSTGMPSYTKISKYPPLVRDISVSSDSVANINKIFDNILLTELIDSYTNPKSKITTNTYRLIFQNIEKSFTKEEIKEIDNKLSEFI